MHTSVCFDQLEAFNLLLDVSRVICPLDTFYSLDYCYCIYSVLFQSMSISNTNSFQLQSIFLVDILNIVYIFIFFKLQEKVQEQVNQHVCIFIISFYNVFFFLFLVKCSFFIISSLRI